MAGLLVFNMLFGAVGALGLLAVFYTSRLRRSQLWTITVTPLASIIGSGFLVAAPLMYANFGSWALLAMILINVFALAVGQVIRTNIRHFDPHRDEYARQAPYLALLEHSSNLALGFSYIISIAFYVALLSAFTLDLFRLYDGLTVRLLSTAILGYIGWTGYRGGLHGLEKLEKIAVNLKLAIIGGLLLALLAYNLRVDGSATSFERPELSLQTLRVLGGLLLITQGFETVKYLGTEYAVQPRIRAMWLAQLIAAVIYIAFVPLLGVLVPQLDNFNETAIIRIVERVAWGMGAVLSIGAIFSQFGAAVADTVGTGGLLAEETRGRLPERRAYVLVALIAISLIWMYNVYTVLTLASRAFALYYGLQALIALGVTWRQPPSWKRIFHLGLFVFLSIALFFITLMAVPAH